MILITWEWRRHFSGVDFTQELGHFYIWQFVLFSRLFLVKHLAEVEKLFCFCEPVFNPENFLQKNGINTTFRRGLKAIHTLFIWKLREQSMMVYVLDSMSSLEIVKYNCLCADLTKIGVNG